MYRLRAVSLIKGYDFAYLFFIFIRKAVMFSRHTLIVIVILFSAHFGFTQNKNTQTLQASYNSYFELSRESVYLHLNKTTFLTGEEIWWSAYVYDKKNNTPSQGTTNLYCGLYDAKGNQLQKELFFVNNSRSNGSFKVSKQLKSGTYYIKAGTSWMKNFKEEEEFVQKITIINGAIEIDNQETTSLDLQLLPEGGHLINGISNSIGVRLINQNGKGIKIAKGEVFDSNDKLVNSFFNNYYGVGKFDLLIEENTTYTVRVTMDNGEIITKNLQQAREKGIALSVNNILEDKLVVSLKTNKLTLKEIQKDKFYLAVHRDGLMTLKEFTFDTPEKSINIDKDKLVSGTNIVTLFNKDLQPVSERIVFNYRNVNIAEVVIEEAPQKIKDSISLKINVFSKNSTPASLSFTALPAETISNNPENNIISTFLLDPYLNGTIENPAYYFNNTTRKKGFELDLVLLTQGWSKYEWDAIFKGSPQIIYPFETGINVQGKILKPKIKEKDQLVIHTGDMNSMFFTEFNGDSTFNLDNLFLNNDDLLNIAIKSKNGKLKKPEIQKITFNTKLKKDKIPENLLKNLGPFETENSTAVKSTIPKNFVSDEIIALDEVVLTEDKIEKKLTRNKQLINSAIFSAYKIDEATVEKNQLLTDFIRRNNFRVTISGNNVFISNPRPMSGPVEVYINDFLVRDGTELFNVELRQIDEIYLERTGFGGSTNAGGGTIRIYRKYPSQLNTFNPRFAQQLVKNTYSKAKEFYRPKYNSYTSKDFSDYGVIHWDPKLLTNSEGEVTVKLPDNNAAGIKVFIEGIGSDGSLVSYTEEINLERP